MMTLFPIATRTTYTICVVPSCVYILCRFVANVTPDLVYTGTRSSSSSRSQRSMTEEDGGKDDDSENILSSCSSFYSP